MTDLLLASLCTKHQEMIPPALRRTIIENLRDDAYGHKFIVPDPLPATTENITKILKEVCAKHCVSLAELRSEIRSDLFSRARFEASYRLRHELKNFSYPRIGKHLGGRDHTTILHAIRRHAERIAEQAGAE